MFDTKTMSSDADNVQFKKTVILSPLIPSPVVLSPAVLSPVVLSPVVLSPVDLRVLEEASASQASSKKDNRVDQSGKNRSYDIRIENFDVSFGER